MAIKTKPAIISSGRGTLTKPRAALLAAGATAEVIRALNFYETTQEADGHWPQNMWLDGSEFWKNIQLDETAAPILLLDLARRYEKVSPNELKRLWPMVRKAAGLYRRSTGPRRRKIAGKKTRD